MNKAPLRRPNVQRVQSQYLSGAMVAIQAEHLGLGDAAFGAGELQAHVCSRTDEVYQQAQPAKEELKRRLLEEL